MRFCQSSILVGLNAFQDSDFYNKDLTNAKSWFWGIFLTIYEFINCYLRCTEPVKYFFIPLIKPNENFFFLLLRFYHVTRLLLTSNKIVEVKPQLPEF